MMMMMMMTMGTASASRLLRAAEEQGLGMFQEYKEQNCEKAKTILTWKRSGGDGGAANIILNRS